MEEKELKNKIISVIISIIIAMTVFILCDMFFKLTTYNSYSCWYIPIFEILFGVIIYSFLCAICKTTLKATIISYVFIFIISIINEIKITFLKEPLYFADIKFLSKIPDLLNLVHQNTSLKFKLYILFAGIIFMIVLTAIIFLNYRYNLKIKSKKTRAIIIITDVILLILLFFPTNFTKNLYLKIFFNNNNIVDFDTYTTNLEYYQINGFINGMYGIVLNNKFFEPSNYDDEMLSKQLEKVENQVMTEINIKPNIITIFSEAFWDIDQLKEVEFNTQITKNFNELKKEGKFINLLSPSYGGMSENVSFELLTGTSMNYFPNGYIPIMSLYKRENIAKAPSIVRELNKNGYDSKIVFGRDYYNSEKAFKKLGFLEYKELEEKDENKKGYFISDKYMMDEIIQELQNKQENQPIFYMAETIQNHMPYTIDKYGEYDVTIEKSNMDEDINNTLLAYAQGAYDAATEVNRLYEFIKQYKEINWR